MKIELYQIDAFANEVFRGNPAAVCLLDHWLPDKLLQKIAVENNLSETAFTVRDKGKWELRWFTPKAEVALCGHATLATAYVLFEEVGISESRINFQSRWSGILSVEKSGNQYILDFPTDDLKKTEIDTGIAKMLGIRVSEQFQGKTDLMFVVENEAIVKEMKPDFSALKRLDHRGFIVTAPGTQSDFVSRFFCPGLGIDEDPVTGSAHTSLTPYWHKRLGKNKMTARQLSERGGHLECEYRGDRVFISGKAVKYLYGELYLPWQEDSPLLKKKSKRLKKVTSIGGVFFKSKDPEKLKDWYGTHLGLVTNEYGSLFEFRESDHPNQIGYLQWSPFTADTSYFHPSEKEFMINYRVENIEFLVESLKEIGVTVLDEIETYEYGKFVHILDPENNKIELWEPVDKVFTDLYEGKTTK